MRTCGMGFIEGALAHGGSARWLWPEWRFGKLDARAVRHVYEAHVAELPRLAGSADLMLGGLSAAGVHKLGASSSTLEVAFHGGGVYQYFDVPRHHYVALTSGVGSVGQYLAHYVKGVYRYRRVE